jgi:hypothetical protein
MLSFAFSAVQADFAGATVTGQVAVGERIVQVQSSPGAIVNYVEAEQRPVPRLRPPPVRRPPRDFPDLLGRQRELEELGQALADASVIEIHGDPGMGKSVLLRRFANRTVQTDAPLVHAACLGRPREDVLQLLFESLYEWDGGAVVVATPAELPRYLSDQQAIVVLDDAELAPDDFQHVRDVARSCTFVWSRGTQSLLGEGRSIALGGLELQDAMALLARGAGRELEEGERPAAEELCRALAGHPLRVLQAGALMRDRATGPAGVLDLVGADAQQVTPALVASLPPDQAKMLAALAAARGRPVPSDLLAGMSGAGDAGAALEGLEKRGLAESHSPRYSFVGELPPVEAEGPTGRNLVETLIASLAAAGPASQPAPDLTAELGVAATLIEDPPPDVDDERLLALAEAIEGPIAARGRWGAWRRVLERQVELARSTSNVASEARALHQLGSRALCFDDADDAAVLLGQALTLRTRIGDEAGIRATRHNLDVLRGPPPSGGNGEPPRPRPSGRGPRYWGTVAALSAIAAGGAAVAVLALSGDDNPPRPSTTHRPTPILSGRLAVPKRVPFAPQPVGSASATVTIPARNDGKAPLRLGSVEMLGRDPREFLIRSNGCHGVRGIRLAPGEHCDVKVSFKPLVAKGRTAQLVFRLADGDTQRVALTGDGVAAVTPAERVAAQINPARLDLSSQAGSRASGTIALTNIGRVAIEIGTVALAPGTSSDFGLDAGKCVGRELAAAAEDGSPSANSTCTMTVSFFGTREGMLPACPPASAAQSPTTSTPRIVTPAPMPHLPCTETGAILVSDTGTGKSATIPISGTATQPPPPG